jgi:hypothetical protein
MLSLRKRPFGRRARVAAVAVAITGAAALAAGLSFTPAGCSSNCKTECPMPFVYIGSADSSTQIPVSGIELQGPACPPNYGIFCIGTPSVGGCTHFTITGQKPGTCDVGIHFSDRPSEIVHLEFGEEQACCSGYPPLGDTRFIVPSSPDAGISGQTSGADAVTVVLDAGTPDGADDDAAAD